MRYVVNGQRYNQIWLGEAQESAQKLRPIPFYRWGMHMHFKSSRYLRSLIKVPGFVIHSNIKQSVVFCFCTEADHVIMKIGLPGLVNVYKKRWKDPPFFMGKTTISMAMFNSYVTNYQRVRYWLSGNPNVSGPLSSPCLASLPGDTSAFFARGVPPRWGVKLKKRCDSTGRRCDRIMLRRIGSMCTYWYLLSDLGERKRGKIKQPNNGCFV